MTVQNIREIANKDGALSVFGMNFRLLDDDLVRLRLSNNIYEILYKDFVNLENNLGLSDRVKNLEVTNLLIEKDEKLPHIMILKIDTRPRKVIHKIEGGIKAGMTYN